MTDTADTNLVLAVVYPDDALHDRAVNHLDGRRLTLPLSVGIELLLVARKWRESPVELVAAADEVFEMPDRDVLLTAAHALEAGDVRTPLDAVHVADAAHRGGALHTADAELVRGPFPTTSY